MPLFKFLRRWVQAPFLYRVLLRDFIRQDINGRFAGSMGGLFWTVITPLATILIYMFVFSVIMKIRVNMDEAGTDEFSIYLLAGLLPWMAFSESLSRSTSILLEKASLITKVRFPVETLPYVGTFTAFILNGLGLLLFLMYLIFKGYMTWAWLYLPPLILLHLLFTLGLFAVISALCVFVRDVQQVMGLLITVWFFLTPIIYPISMVPPEYQSLFMWNPAYYFTELYRQVLLQGSVSPALLGSVAFMSVLIYAAGGWLFMRIKHAFGDVL